MPIKPEKITSAIIKRIVSVPNKKSLPKAIDKINAFIILKFNPKPI